MAPKSYRAAVIGCGRIGCGFIKDTLRGAISTHAGSYVAVEGVNLVAICDRKRELVEQCAEDLGVCAYQNYHKMMEGKHLDIVSICTPPETHCEILHSVSGYNSVKAIYCEKPIAVNRAAAEYMIQVCNERNILLMINHQRRFSPLHQEIARIIREGELGRIQQVTCYYGGGVFDSGSHLFDLLRFYLGEVNVMRGHWSHNVSHRPGDPNIDGWLRLDDGTLVSIQACDASAYAIFEISILGTEGRLRVTDKGRRAALEHIEVCPTFTGIRELSEATFLPLSLPHATQDCWIPHGIWHMLDCLRMGKQSISSGEDGLAALKIIEALISSARRGGG